MKLTLLKLPYAYDALEPHIDARTMEIHHTKHHAGYTKKLSVALEEAGNLDVDSVDDLIRNLDRVPEKIRTAVRNNGGGYVNHNLFWTIMSPGGGGQPTEPLGSALKSKFGDLSTFMERFADAALGRFGSGWAWLVLDENDDLLITDTPNQDSPLMNGQTPILGLDVWEHAYYLKYQNRRTDYVAAWWETVNWPAVARRYEMALEKAGATV